MKPSDEYTEVRLHRPEELDFDGAQIVRPEMKVVTFTPESGYGEAITSDRDLQKRRTEEASKTPLVKKKTVVKATANKIVVKKKPVVKK